MERTISVTREQREEYKAGWRPRTLPGCSPDVSGQRDLQVGRGDLEGGEDTEKLEGAQRPWPLPGGHQGALGANPVPYKEEPNPVGWTGGGLARGSLGTCGARGRVLLTHSSAVL